MSTITDNKVMLWKTVLFVVICGFRPCFSFKFEPNFPQISKELSNKTAVICLRHLSSRTSSITLSAEVESIAAWHQFNDFSDQLLKPIGHLKVQLDIFGFYHSKLWDYFNIIYVDSESSFRRINPGEKTRYQDFSEYYLVVFRPLSYHNYLLQIEAIFSYCWNYYIVNVSIMLKDSDGVYRIFTYYPFTKTKCFSTSAVEIFGLEFNEVFPPKTLDLHHCELIGAFWFNPPYISWNRDPISIDRFNGMEGQMLKEIAKNMNFTIKVITPPNDERRGLFFKNGTVTGAIKLEKEAHLSLGCFRCTLERATALSSSNNFYQTPQVFFVKAHTEPWSTFEIMTYPFDFYIWTIMLTIIITAIVLSIFLENYLPSVLHFVFGSTSSGNVFNIISSWLGYAVIPEPKRNFARFVLTLWLFSALVLRHAYQGLLYNFLSSNFAKLPPDTALQLAEQNYLMVVSYSSNDTLSEHPMIRNRRLRVVVKNINEKEAYPLLENTNAKVVTSLPRDFLSYHVMETRKYGVFHVLKETIFTHQICVYFTKHSFLTARFNKILSHLRSFGLIDLWASKNKADDMIELHPSGPSGGSSLTMHQLKGTFIMLFMGSVVAMLAFAVERLSLKYHSLRRWFE